MGSQLKMSYTREQNFVRTQAKPLKPKPRQQQGHFDPEELTRRLYLVLADQKAHTQSRRARAEEARLKGPRSWTGRRQSNDAAGGGSKEAATRETSAAHSSKQTSLKPTGSVSSGELGRKKSSKPGAAERNESPRAAQPRDAHAPKAAAPEPAAHASGYHHVPQEAAKQFQRTTTVDGMRDSHGGSSSLAHKLSKQALKLHLAAGAAAHSSSLRAAATSDDHTKPISPVERLLKDRERVDDWRSRIPEEPEAAEMSEEREERAEYQAAPQYQPHSFHAELARLSRPTAAAATAEHHLHLHPDQNRRNSTGDILARAEDNRLSMVLVERPSLLADVLEDPATAALEPELAVAVDEHRVDWTQSDETAAAEAAMTINTSAQVPTTAQQQRHKPLLSPLLRKADSIWTLRGRLGSGSSKGSFGAAQEKGSGDMAQIPESPRSPTKEPRAGFFAKFKR